MRTLPVYLTLGVAALLTVACSSDTQPSSTTSSSSSSSSTTSTVSFATIQSTILTPACEGCHTDVNRTAAGGLNLKPGAAYPNLVSQVSSAKSGATRVVPGNASGSYLIQKLEGASDIVGLRMPRNGPPYLTDAQVATIRTWITEGAKNN